MELEPVESWIKNDANDNMMSNENIIEKLKDVVPEKMEIKE